MLYERKSFTLPAGGSKLTELEWEVAIGIRCAWCKELQEDCKCRERIHSSTEEHGATNAGAESSNLSGSSTSLPE